MTSTKETQTVGIKKPVTEVITPHKLTLTILIRNYCLYREDEKFKGMEDEVLRCKYRRDFSVLMLRLLQSPDLPHHELRNLFTSKKYLIPQTLIESFNQSLSTLNKLGVGNLLDIVESLQKLMNHADDPTNNGVIAKSSIVGYYLRRFNVYFDKLTFSEVTGVYENFQRYYEEWRRTSRFLNTAEETVDNWCNDREQWSRRQAELFIATQASLLAFNEGKALPPKELLKRIKEILKSNPDLSGAHFLSYLNYLRVDEYCGALDSLLHCFDRNVDPDLKSFNDEKSRRVRFASLNLAILHYHFGHTEEALTALKESIKISQQTNDNVCLQQALSWLYLLTNVNEDKLMIHCILKSSELRLSYTASLALQTFGQYGCLHNQETYEIFETLAKSDMINCQHNYKDLISNNHAIKSSLWQLYGKTEMSSLWSQLLLYQNMDSVSPSRVYYGEGFCLAVCNIANHLLIQGEYALVNCIISFAKKRFPYEPHSRHWMLCENLFVFTRSLYHEKWTEAESAAQKILVVNKWEGYLRLAEVYFYKQDYVEADNCVEMLLKQYENDNSYKFSDGYYYVRAKIVKAEIQFASSHPDSIPAGIITILNNCLIESQTSHLDYQTALVHLHIANCLLLIGLTGQALKVLDKCLIQILGHGGCYDRARATLLYAKCLIADSHKLEEDMRKEVILNCTRMLDKVKKNFKKVEAYSRVKDVLYLQSQLYHMVNMKEERNKCALDYRLLDEERETRNIYTLVKYV
nr:anaphase-promoting complex subunit 5 [Leptinotarsa decemlineata]